MHDPFANSALFGLDRCQFESDQLSVVCLKERKTHKKAEDTIQGCSYLLTSADSHEDA